MSLLLLALVLVSCLADDTIPNIDPYEVLGVPRTATQSEIRSAYKKLALQYHPDKNQGEDTSDIFSSINAAYDILGTTLFT
jgi:curved DNA-binding protein CbpA